MPRKPTNSKPLPTVNGPTKPQTESYAPFPSFLYQVPRDLPVFTFWTIRSMLFDPGVNLNLKTRQAPIQGLEFAYQDGLDANNKPIWKPGVRAKNPAVAAWVYRQLQTIWRNYLPMILRAQVFGWAGGEVTLRVSEYDLIEIDKLLERSPSDVRVLKFRGNRSGVRIKNVKTAGHVDLDFPYAWYHAYNPVNGEEYGNSVLIGAYSPWADKWLNGGALDTRRLFMHKDAYGGMSIQFPEEDVTIGTQQVPARDFALQVVEQAKNGSVLAFPSTCDDQGKEKWIVKRAEVSSNPAHILQFPKDCDDEIRTGMEIPDDVISNDGSGAWAGKRIPLAAFYSSLDVWVVQLLADLRHTLEPLILLNWGKAEDFEICHKPLALQAMEQQGDASGQPQENRPQTSESAWDGQRMSLNPVEAVASGAVRAADIVRAAKTVIRMSTDDAPNQHKFGCVMFGLPRNVSKLALDTGASIANYVPQHALASDGFEDQPHITALYGITGVDVNEVVSFVSQLDPPRVRFSQIDSFPAGKDGVPVFVSVESEDLQRINAELKAAFPHVETHPIYRPHMTIAYLNEMDANILASENLLDGIICDLPNAIVSMPGCEQVVVPLRSPIERLATDGPNEGDTKPGADGELVFRDGRWRKTDDDKPQPTRKLQGTHENIDSLIDDALKPGRDGNKFFVQFGHVSQAEVQVIKDKLGIDASNFVHSISEGHIRHALNGHGVGKEKSPDLIPITTEDIKKIPEIVASPDRINIVRDQVTNQPIVVFSKRFNGTTVVAEAVGLDKKRLDFRTMYKHKSKS